MDTPYQYLPLSQDEIRVMVLLKGRPEDPLACQLFHVCLENFSLEKKRLRRKQRLRRSRSDKPRSDKPRSYEALSYVWGSLSASESLGCDGKRISITPNLRDGLRKLRLTDRHRALWVDQVCINQSDKDERSSQVSLMGRIYKTAKQVIAWLGLDPDGHRNLAHAFLIDIARGKFRDFHEPLTVHDLLLKERNLPPMDDVAWEALNTFICLPYFARSWILQEVALARSVVFVWDELQFPFKDFASLGNWLRNNIRLYSDQEPLLDHTGVSCVATLRVDLEGKRLEDLILYSIVRARTDPRDLVYSILDLIKSGQRIQPSYDKTVLEVYRDATLQAIIYGRDLDILSTVHHNTEEDIKPRDWPSWVPRWIESPPPQIGDNRRLRRLFCAYKPEGLHKAPLLVDGSTLELEGRSLTSVASVISLGPMDSEGRLDCQNVSPLTEAIWTAWCTANGSRTVQERYPELSTAFAFTLFCGVPEYFEDQSLREKLCYEGFAAWWTYRVLSYSLTDDFPHDPLEYVSERIHPARLAKDAAPRSLQTGTTSTAIDISLPDIFDEGLKEKFGESTAKEILRLTCDLWSNERFISFTRYWEESGQMRDFFVLRDGHIGMGPWVVKENDTVAILSGGTVPYCLRPTHSSGHTFLGECYVHGVMFGEAYDEHDKRMFRLV